MHLRWILWIIALNDLAFDTTEFHVTKESEEYIAWPVQRAAKSQGGSKSQR